MRAFIFAAFVVTALAMPFAAPKAAIIITSNPGDTCTLGSGGSCTSQAITPVASAWQPNNPNGNGAVWISHTNSGQGGVSPPDNFGTPLSIFSETFTAAKKGTLFLDVWADDTAEVKLNGSSIFAPNFTTDGTCSGPGPIGCEPNEGAMIEMKVAAGTHTLDVEGYQLRGDGYGVLYSGRFVEAPAPATIILLAAGLFGLGILNRRRGAA